jgi:hypothetical protein
VSERQLLLSKARIVLYLSVFNDQIVLRLNIGPQVRANSEPAASRAPPKALASPARGAPHTEEFGLLEPEPSQTRTCMGTFTFRRLTILEHAHWTFFYT